MRIFLSIVAHRQWTVKTTDIKQGKELYMSVVLTIGLNDIEMKIQITPLRESINFSECFLKV